MGGGNAQKSKMAREKNLEKQKAAGKGSQLDTNKKAMTIQCKVCMQTFMCTTTEVKCKEHAEAKHPKSGPMKLRQDVRRCDYDDVRVMWDMLKKKNRTELGRRPPPPPSSPSARTRSSSSSLLNVFKWARCSFP